MLRDLKLLPALALLFILPGTVAASTAPTTPTFVLACGNLGTAPAQFTGASAVAVDAVGNVYVADTNNHTIRKYDAQASMVTTLAGTPGVTGRTDALFPGP